MSNNKLSFGRKFLAMILGIVFLSLFLGISLILNKDAVNSMVLITYGAYILTLLCAYIGGNVWQKWASSKYLGGNNESKGGIE